MVVERDSEIVRMGDKTLQLVREAELLYAELQSHNEALGLFLERANTYTQEGRSGNKN